jgi:tetratricopeptide (TPR) repeat protein
MRVTVPVLFAAVLVASVPAAWSAGGGPANMPNTNMGPAREETPEDKARSAYNSGVRQVKKADKAAESAEKATDARKKDKAEKEARELYAGARDKFMEAVSNSGSMYEAWNYLGYTRRKLGDYDAALTAYDKALTLKPSYAEAIEYRGEAYLRLNRFDDAKQAYLDLFAGNRALADRLLGSMKSWVEAHRSAAAGADPSAIEALDKWVQERAQIAGQTAALTREGTEASWR